MTGKARKWAVGDRVWVHVSYYPRQHKRQSSVYEAVILSDDPVFLARVRDTSRASRSTWQLRGVRYAVAYQAQGCVRPALVRAVDIVESVAERDERIATHREQAARMESRSEATRARIREVASAARALGWGDLRAYPSGANAELSLSPDQMDRLLALLKEAL